MIGSEKGRIHVSPLDTSRIMRAMSKKKAKKPSNVIARNRRASFDYELLDTYEAGVVLAGWEVKSLRMGKADLADSYVLMKNGEAWLLGSHIIPLNTASTHFVADPTRTRKLLMKKRELAKILEATAQKGQACVCTQLYWKGHLVKARLALAVGKKAHDKRDTEKDRDWDRQKQRVVRDHVRQ
jgi:SsrA-binding protein